MTELRDYADFGQGPLELPYKGKVYTPPEISIELGMRLNGITNHGQEAEMDAVELFQLVLGPLWGELIADGVPMRVATRIGAVTLADFQYGRDYATAMWETDGDPKAMARHMAAKTGNRASRRSKNTGAATKTR